MPPCLQEMDCLDISLIRDTRTGKYAKLPKVSALTCLRLGELKVSALPCLRLGELKVRALPSLRLGELKVSALPCGWEN